MKAQVVVTVAVRAALLTIALTAVAAAGLPQAAASAQGGPQPKQAPGALSSSHVAARSGTVPDSYIVSLRSGDAGVVAAEQAGRDGASVTHVFRSAMRGYAARMTPRRPPGWPPTAAWPQWCPTGTSA